VVKIHGMELNLEKSSAGTNGAMWSLYFNPGYFYGNGVIRSTEASEITLKKSDYNCTLPCGYHMFYNPWNNKYTLIESKDIEDCNDYGYSIGGFIVKNCKIGFVYPKDCEDIEYRRSFDESYDDLPFNQLDINCETPQELLDEVCGTFLEENFSNDYDINCIVYEENNQFKYCEFDPEEFESDIVSDCN